MVYSNEILPVKITVRRNSLFFFFVSMAGTILDDKTKIQTV